jgi:hypothetical protein
VLFGGSGSSSRMGDTWEWDGVAWTLVSEEGPRPRMGHMMVYDSVRGVVLLHGGSGVAGEFRLTDTWEWDGLTWTQVATEGPPPRSWSSMAFDSARGRAVLFGGNTYDGRANDTWEWDGTQWMLVATTGPQAREAHGMAYDAARGVTVLFAGFAGPTGSGAPIKDTWEWNGVVWTQVAWRGPGGDGSPLARDGRNGHAMAYDAARGRVVIFGGDWPATNGMWEWDGAGWSPVVYSGIAPPPLENQAHGMVYDPARQALLMYGGFDRPASTTRDDLWIYSVQDRFRLPSVQGACNGVLQARARSATPFGMVNFYMGTNLGSTSVTIAGCGKLTVPLKGGITLMGSVQADANGDAVLNFTLPRNACGRYLVAIDRATCKVSNETRMD